MKRIIIHWTAGGYIASALDRRHYHRLIEGDGRIVEGLYPIEANTAPIRGYYAAHTRNLNSDSIGVAICAMAGATEAPFDVGRYPIRINQWVALDTELAALCQRYQIPVTPQTVLTHAEVQPTLGVAQRGKWDIRTNRAGHLRSALEVGNEIRAAVAERLGTPAAQPIALRVEDLPLVGDKASIRALQRRLGVADDGVLGPNTYRALLSQVRP